jgi:hypothetical protein
MNTNKHPSYRVFATALAMAIIAVAMALAPVAAHAQLVVAGTNFNADTNPDGSVSWNFNGTGNPASFVTNDLPEAPSTQNLAWTFLTTNGVGLNFGLQTSPVSATGNTNTSLANYTLNFDLAIQGVSINALGGFVAPTLALFGPGSGLYFGQGILTNPPVTFFPAAGTGYQHYSLPLGGWAAANAAKLNPTAASFTFAVGFFMSGPTVTTNEEIDIANVQLVMNTNPPPPVPPTMTTVAAKPGLRVFAQNIVATYNQEGFSTVNNNQSWVGAGGSHPSYSINIGDFDTVNNYTLYAQFVQGGFGINPYIAYANSNCFTWSITRAAGGFTSSVAYKVNLANSGPTNTIMNMTSTSLDGRGVWNLTFTSDSNGIVTAPDGTTGSFVIPPGDAGIFANPLNISCGTAPNNAAGFGQFIDINQIIITNLVSGENENDNFAADASLNSSLWNPNFSLDAGSVVLAPAPGPAYWVHWTIPDDGFALETKAYVNNPSIPWNSPGYYSGGTVTLTPTLMGPTNKWVLVPTAGLPTLDGTASGTRSTNMGYFRLIKFTATQLQVLFDGETNAPGTVLGYTGSPTPVSGANSGGAFANVTINAVDSTFHIVPGVTDTIHLTCSADPNATEPTDAALVNGTLTEQVLISAPGNWTVMATDTSAHPLTSGTSAAITVNP